MDESIEALRVLHRLVLELDKRSLELREANVALEPTQRAYQNFIDAHELATYRAATQSSSKVPSADLRLKEALEAMPEDVMSAYRETTAKRERLKERCKHLETEMDAWRTIASAEKSIIEATQ